MKKIVALVLSLALALSLCTVAFAAVGNHVYDAVDGKVVKTNDWYGDFAGYEGLALDYVKAVSLKDGDGFIAYYTLENPNGTFYLIPCTQTDAEFAIYKDGVFVSWVFDGGDEMKTVGDKTGPLAAYYTEVVTAQKATSAKPNCTTSQFFEDGYLDADGCCFFVDDENGVAVNLDGKIIFVKDVTKDTDYVVWASHVFAKGVANDKMGYDVAKCLICKGEFGCTNNVEVATKTTYKIETTFSYSSTDAGNVYNENKYENGYSFNWNQAYAGDYEFCWQLKAGTTEEIGTAATTTTTTGVESAKTFDAGIAMYVGMSLMSVAGTAVVIGKKKEF